VIYVKGTLGLDSQSVAMALAASGGGSMLAALSLPKVLDRVPDRPVMLLGAVVMAVGVGLISFGPGFYALLPIWFLIGLGWSLVQTPSGRVVNRSSSAADRPAFFSAQFALSHLCWLVFYPIAGQLGTRLGVPTTAMFLAGGILLFALLAARLWPRSDAEVLRHAHDPVTHSHEHSHDDEHHDHPHGELADSHSHEHVHEPVVHAHAYHIDDHHALWPAASRP
jgi:MFS family permease